MDDFVEVAEITYLLDDIRGYLRALTLKTPHDLCFLFIPGDKLRYTSEILGFIKDELLCGLFVVESRNNELRALLTDWDEVINEQNFFNRAEIISRY